MSKMNYLQLADHYRLCLKEEGDTFLGMGWPREEDNATRFNVLIDFIRPHLNDASKVSILDFGCGTSHFYEHLIAKGLEKSVVYTGIDILEESILLSKNKFPKNNYICTDILKDPSALDQFDLIVINGLFTQRRGMKIREMKFFLETIIGTLFKEAKIGLAFNAMSQFVDYRKKGAFHINLAYASRFISQDLSRRFVIRQDYGLYENTFYIYR